MAQRSEARQFRGVFSRVAVGATTVDVPSIAAGAQGTVTITVPGVTLDGTWVVLGEGSSANPGAVSMDAHVTAADTVTLYIQNNSGGAIDPASMTYRVVCGKITDQMAL